MLLQASLCAKNDEPRVKRRSLGKTKKSEKQKGEDRQQRHPGLSQELLLDVKLCIASRYYRTRRRACGVMIVMIMMAMNVIKYANCWPLYSCCCCWARGALADAAVAVLWTDCGAVLALIHSLAA